MVGTPPAYLAALNRMLAAAVAVVVVDFDVVSRRKQSLPVLLLGTCLLGFPL